MRRLAVVGLMALTATLAACASDPRISQIDEREIHVVGGEGYRVTDPHFYVLGQYPSVVALTTPGGTLLACSGVLVDNRTVLTAAHCACRRHEMQIAFGLDAYDAMEVRAVTERRLAPGAGCTPSSQRGRDLALLTMATEVPPGPFRDAGAAIAPSHPVGNFSDARVIIVTGFGATAHGTVSPGRQAGTAVSITSPTCSDPLDRQMRYDCESGLDLVAISRRREGVRPDSCRGDSGGPAWVEGRDGRKVVAAIVARGVRPGARCGDGGIYTLVTPVIVAAIRRQEPLDLGL